MAFGLYKPGQGYWVRVMTAVVAGLLILATSAWLWQQVETISLPKPTWNLALRSIDGGPDAVPPAGQPVELVLDEPGADGAATPTVIGRATVRSVDVRSDRDGALIIGDIRMEPTYDPSQAVGGRVRTVGAEGVEPGAAPPFSGEVIGAAGIPVIQPLYLQATVVGLLILAGTALTWWLVGVRPQTADFLIATDGEMKKVNWSTRREVVGSTWVVISACVLIASGLFIADFLFSSFFDLIGVLEKQ